MRPAGGLLLRPPDPRAHPEVGHRPPSEPHALEDSGMRPAKKACRCPGASSRPESSPSCPEILRGRDEPPVRRRTGPPSKTRACRTRPDLSASTARPGPLVVGHPCPPWATVPELRPPATVRPATAPGAGDGPDRPARVMRPAGGLSAPRAHPGPDGSGIRALHAAASPPMIMWGGFGGRGSYWRGEKGVKKGLPLRSGVGLPVPASALARPRSLAPPPPDRPRCHAASARPGPGSSPAFHRAAPARPFRRRPRPARAPSPPLRRIGLDATRPRPAPRHASSRVRPRGPGSPVPGRPRPARAPRPPPARAAARPPCRSGRGLQRAASMRPVRLIIHIFTVPEIPYFTGFSARQAR